MNTQTGPAGAAPAEAAPAYPAELEARVQERTAALIRANESLQR